MDESITAAIRDNPQAPENLPETVEVTTGEHPGFSVIWLHGLGADGHDFEPVIPHLGLGSAPPVRFVFPHAPVRPVTLNGGMRMRAWYDIRSLSDSRDQDEPGIRHAAGLVAALVARENDRGVRSENIVLAGFSQGAAVASYAAPRHPERLGGLVMLSGYLLFPERLEDECNAANRDLPVFIAHGTQDPVVPFMWGRASAERLGEMGFPLTWRTYPTPHSVSMEEIRDIGQWIRARLQS